MNTASSERSRLVVAAAIVDSLEAPTVVLAARRTAPPALAGRWELPGGKVEPGEEPQAALHRELEEELGIRVRCGDLLAGPLPDSAWPLAHPYRMQVWFAVVDHAQPQPLQDHDELRDLDAEALDSVPWLDSDADIVEALRAHLRP